MFRHNLTDARESRQILIPNDVQTKLGQKQLLNSE